MPVAAPTLRILRRRPSVPECGERGAAGARARARVSARPRSRRERPRGWLVSCSRAARRPCWSRRCLGSPLEDKIATARALMRAGVAIDGLNCVRKHLSRDQRRPARRGRGADRDARDLRCPRPRPNDPSVIGSGPTVGDPTTFAQALAIVRHVDDVPATVRRYLERGARGDEQETIKPDDARLAARDLRGHRQSRDGRRRRCRRRPRCSAIPST